MNFTTSLLILLGLIVLTGCPEVDDGWVAFTSEEHGFEARFPANPLSSSQTIMADMGQLTLHRFEHKIRSSSADTSDKMYMVVHTTYPEGTVHSDNAAAQPQFFRNSIDGAVSNVKGKLISEQEITIDGYPGREVVIDYRNNFALIHARYYLVENQLFMLQAIVPGPLANDPSIRQFFNAFRLL